MPFACTAMSLSKQWCPEDVPPIRTATHHALCACSHAIVSSLVGPEYYVNIMSFVDKTQLEPGCSILLHNKVGCPATCGGITL